MDSGTIIFFIMIVIGIIMIILHNRKGKAKVKELEAAGKVMAEEILNKQKE